MDRVSDFDLSDKKLYKEKHGNIFIYEIPYKTLMGAKPLRIRFNEIDGFINTHNGIRCLVLFDNGWFDKICDNIL